MSTGPNDSRGAAAAQNELNRLNDQIQSMRSVLVTLLQDVLKAETSLDSAQASHLIAANEQLIISALGAQSASQDATSALADATRTAERDPLTQLPNRNLLLDRLGQSMSNAKRRGHRVAVMFLDLNNFKEINDTFGHSVGDAALKMVANCLTSLVRESDTVSRHGGDEFLLVLADIGQPQDAALIAEKIIETLGRNTRIEQKILHISASIGISIYPEDGLDAKILIDRADAAMYLAKKQELGGFVFHSDPLQQPEATGDLPAPAPRLTHLELTLAEHELRSRHLQEANERLVIAALDARELRAAAQSAQQHQTELLAVVAQELSNPHSPIRTAAAMLGRADASPQLLSGAKSIVDRHLDRVSQMVDSMLSPALRTGSALATEHLPFDLSAVVREALRNFQVKTRSRQQFVDAAIPLVPMLMVGDRTLMSLVITNLLANATAYTPRGGKIRLAVEKVDDAVVITVADNGIGIEPDALTTIFDAFVRDPRACVAEPSGTGIGLTVVRTVVAAHGGTVRAASSGVGQGSQFVVSIPLGAP